MQLSKLTVKTLVMTIFAFADSADTEAPQEASDTTNRCDLEVLQFLDDSN